MILNFTLQFLKIEQRQKLLDRIYKGLNPGGALIISEKFKFKDIFIDELLFNIHHDFKKNNGYSELEIMQKNSMLLNVMKTDLIDVHKNRLTKAGFKYIELCFQYLNFGSLLAIKSE